MIKSTIFISHINQEKEIANSLKEFLEKKFLKTINVFASSHEESLKLGDDWMGTIKESVRACKLIIVLCSPISIVRPWINFEAGAGWVKDIPVIPLCHSGLTPEKLPFPMSFFQAGFLNNREDISKVFDRIAKICDIAQPDPSDKEFFSAIQGFEIEIKNSALLKDTTFIHNLLFPRIELLEYSIYASTLDYNERQGMDLSIEKLENHNFTFNDTYNLFNLELLTIFPTNTKVCEIYYQTVHELSDNIKFILTYSRIQIAPTLRELLDRFLFSIIKVDIWYADISRYCKDTSTREELINMIKEEPLPPIKRNHSNIIDCSIAYYESLKYFQSWLISYNNEIKTLLENNNKS